VKRKKAKSLDVCDTFDTPSPSKLSRVGSAGGLHMYLTHNVIFLSYSINGGWTNCKRLFTEEESEDILEFLRE
jgi:hypothetical protein